MLEQEPNKFELIWEQHMKQQEDFIKMKIRLQREQIRQKFRSQWYERMNHIAFALGYTGPIGSCPFD